MSFVVAWVILLLAFIVGFAIIETIAIRRGGTTLSRLVVHVSQAWPLLPFVLGLIVGGLAVHFWWPYCPLQTCP